MFKLSRGLPVIVAAVLVGVLAQSSLAVYYWDPNGDDPGVGGSGTWDTTSLQWRNGSTTGPLVAWTDGQVATFSTTAGTVTLGANVYTEYMTANLSGLLIDLNGHTLTHRSNFPLGILGATISNGMIRPSISGSTGTLTTKFYSGTGTISATITNGVNAQNQAVASNLLAVPGDGSGAGTSVLVLKGQNNYTGTTTADGYKITGFQPVYSVIRLEGGSLPNGKITLADYGILRGTAGFTNTVHFNLADDAGDLIQVLLDGKLEIDQLTLALNVTGSQTQGEYVLADYSAAGAAGLSGTGFANVTGLKPGWSIDYDGTAASGANKIVLLVPEPASLVGLALGGLLILRRR